MTFTASASQKINKVNRLNGDSLEIVPKKSKINYNSYIFPSKAQSTVCQYGVEMNSHETADD